MCSHEKGCSYSLKQMHLIFRSFIVTCSVHQCMRAFCCTFFYICYSPCLHSCNCPVHWVSLTDTAMLILMCLSVWKSWVLWVSLSMASCSLKAYGLKWQEGAADVKAIISPNCTSAGNKAALKEWNRGRNDKVTESHPFRQLNVM